jgi:hypothetical protein
VVSVGHSGHIYPKHIQAYLNPTDDQHITSCSAATICIMRFGPLYAKFVDLNAKV